MTLDSLADIAALLAGTSALLFFAIFIRHRDDAALLVSNPSDRRVKALNAGLILVAVFAPVPFKAVAMAVGFPLLARQHWLQQATLRQAGASPQFLWRLNAVSALACLSMAMFCVVLLAR